jgi:hypothetical protein
LKPCSLAELKPAPLPARPAPTNKHQAVEYPAPASLQNVPRTTARAAKGERVIFTVYNAAIPSSTLDAHYMVAASETQKSRGDLDRLIFQKAGY